MSKINNLGKYSINNGLIQNSTKKIGDAMEAYDDFMRTLVDKIKSAVNYKEAEQLLIKTSQDTDSLSMHNGVLFKHDDYAIQVLFKSFGEQYDKKLKLLSKLDLSIVPKRIESIDKDVDMFIVSKIPGTKNGELKPLWDGGYQCVSKEAKLTAYRDLQKLTKAGFVDDTILNSNELWFYSPENKIVLPEWRGLRKIQPQESRKDIMEKYYNILFRW